MKTRSQSQEDEMAVNHHQVAGVHEPEFEQAYGELASSLENSTVFERNPRYRKALEVVAVPERVIIFRVTWQDDRGNICINRGYRVQFSSVLGPYKGGLRFHPSVNLSILKFLGFEQIFKNALTGLNIGGGKGGADFNPKGRSDNEIRRFCVAFMNALCRHIGADTDVPAGDIGVSGREIGWMFGAYRAARNRWEGVLTGKGLSWGGSFMRPEATGYGLVYFVEHMMKYATNGTEKFKGKRVAVSGSGNVAQYAALKVIQLGGIVVSLSDSTGLLVVVDDSDDHDNDGQTPLSNGISTKLIEKIAQLKVEGKQLSELMALGDSDSNGDSNVRAFTKYNSSKLRYVEGARPWKEVGRVYVALPCATQNEIDSDSARALIECGCKFVAEGSNMGCTEDSVAVFEEDRKSLDTPARTGGNGSQSTAAAADVHGIWYAPGKAANAGGVAVSGLEMAQNSQRQQLTREQVDDALREIMENCFNQCVETAEEYARKPSSSLSSSTTGRSIPHILPSLVAGANIAGFLKVAEAMIACGDIF